MSAKPKAREYTCTPFLETATEIEGSASWSITARRMRSAASEGASCWAMAGAANDASSAATHTGRRMAVLQRRGIIGNLGYGCRDGETHYTAHHISLRLTSGPANDSAHKVGMRRADLWLRVHHEMVSQSV